MVGVYMRVPCNLSGHSTSLKIDADMFNNYIFFYVIAQLCLTTSLSSATNCTAHLECSRSYLVQNLVSNLHNHISVPFLSDSR